MSKSLAKLHTWDVKMCVWWYREADRQELSSRHSFNLIMAPVEGTPRSMVYIRLLGPFSAKQDTESIYSTHAISGSCHAE